MGGGAIGAHHDQCTIDSDVLETGAKGAHELVRRDPLVFDAETATPPERYVDPLVGVGALRPGGW
jgi:hypothetical protein